MSSVGRLSRLTANGDVMTGPEQVLINDWCQQFPSHSQGDLRFGPDGMLYGTSGDGSSFTTVDYGQFGGGTGSPTQKNPCGDPPAGVGGTMTPPTAEGGALRSQDLRTPATAGHGSRPTGSSSPRCRRWPIGGWARRRHDRGRQQRRERRDVLGWLHARGLGAAHRRHDRARRSLTARPARWRSPTPQP